jgi:iron complex outermembrane receptor protein
MARANIAHFLSYEIPTASGGTEDVAGYFNHDNFARSLPETKANISMNWMMDRHSAAAIIYYVDSYETTRPIPEGESKDIDDWTTLDLQYAYNLPIGDGATKFTLGVKNITDEDPPRAYDSVNLSYDPKHHDPRGRTYYVNLAYRY